MSAKADEVAAMVKSQEGKVEEYKKELERRSKAEERVPLNEEDAIQLASARQLIVTKALSWNRLISDIERFVPYHAKVVSVQVAGSSDAGGVEAEVEIKAIGQTSGQLTEMMESLEKSGGLFEVRNFTQEAVAESGEVPFMLRVTYVPNRGEG